MTKTELNCQREPLILLNILTSDDSVGLMPPAGPSGYHGDTQPRCRGIVLLKGACYQSVSVLFYASASGVALSGYSNHYGLDSASVNAPGSL